ncbi:hypothetical protein Tco_0069392 [Tanacetum coccineum]
MFPSCSDLLRGSTDNFAEVVVWVCEILGECDEICGSKNKTDNESDNDSCTNHGENVDDGDANEEDDDFQDGDDYSPFINEGGWIREDMTEKSLEDIESSPENNSKFPANSSPMKLLIVLSKITKSREEEVSREHIESFVGCSLNPSISPIQLPRNSATTQAQSSNPNSILGSIPSSVPILLKYNNESSNQYSHNLS